MSPGSGPAVTAALTTLEQANELARANADDPQQLLSAATPYLRMLSQVVGGWLLGVEALAATRVVGTVRADAAFLDAKVATAQFYADHLLPLVDGLLATTVAGKADLFAVEL